MFRALVLIIRRSKLYYTASGIITPVGGRLVHRLREDSLCASTCVEHHVLIIRRSKLHYTASGVITTIGGRPVHRLRETATYRCDDTRCCIIQFWPPDDEHMCSKHVEAWNKIIVKQKFCASIWLITEINTRLYCNNNITLKMAAVASETRWWEYSK